MIQRTTRVPPQLNRSPVLAQAATTIRHTAKLMGDRLDLSTSRKLLEGNERAVKHAARSFMDTLVHPLDTIKRSVGGMAQLILHPSKMVDWLESRFQKDPVDGMIASANAVAAYSGVGALLLFAGAYVAAPFTAGASLGLLPVAGALGTVAGTVGMGGLVGSIAKNEWDLMQAETPAELETESRELAQDMTAVGIDLVLSGVSTGVERGVTRLRKTPPLEQLERSLPRSLAQAAPEMVPSSLVDAISMNLEYAEEDE